jgi:exodeoxyribonuclease VII large subunit
MSIKYLAAKMKSSLLNSLFDNEDVRPLSVSELTAQVKGELERRFASVWVEGEIVNFIAAGSGHWYFNLNDGFSQVRAVCFRLANSRIKFKPFDGVQVRVRGRLAVYEKRGEYQLLVDSLEPAGEGALKAAFEQIKTKLESEGLFHPERKRSLPLFPKRIAVITSPDGAVIHDILNVLTRRTRSVSVIIVPARVQGEFAGEEIASAIELANKFNAKISESEKIDALIIGRGGGSAEDLWAFNEERVARAIYSSKIPVISAVGHETDFTIADLVADMRAPTPSAAAELVAAHEAQLENFIADRQRNLAKLISWKLLETRNDLQSLALSYVFTEFPQSVREMRQTVETSRREAETLLRNRLVKNERRLENLTQRLSPVKLSAGVTANHSRLSALKQKKLTAITKRIDEAGEKIKIGMASLDALSPLSVLGRGYAIAYKENGAILRDAKQALPDEQIKVQLAAGMIKARIEEVKLPE